ncbi:MAG: fumarylacetoacetate hydrolase family protein [Ancrocorticia sp.]|jgi:2-keto-4-pentenoate hydratase/2-oxohepta-3-ene-1,7-dioic acid hydratase in catechol pathway|nr:fumarylacetoacetate hydrolase family protein [Ancrocorticia sp.]MCI1896487.1 fumarylacetoacetate hydrolase family protein [Ancrocorticia sp.]MCI1933174.1 fumarylacetoacetate hydrolase family protein [Ancrocorticia sp.]MCI1964097.1 fumarylacetoacetate hydrolase family protein [Ancrocorticia sp.]MCI2001781.1 fumarylacetoacetate hydrolase family protein [Ancrocorticia sp.]
MKIARLGMTQGPRFAVLDDQRGEYIVLADDPMFGQIEPTGQKLELDEGRPVAPMLPRSKVVGLGGTYGAKSLDELAFFLKPNTSVIGPEDPAIIPTWAPSFLYEAELAVVISRVAKQVTVKRSPEVIFGYTLTNDITVSGVVGDRAKVFDTSCPLGPVITTDFDPSSAEVTMRIDGTPIGTQAFSNLTYSVPELVAYVSSICTLLPGDIIMTGAAVSSEGQPGQLVEVACEGIGSIHTRVVRDED